MKIQRMIDNSLFEGGIMKIRRLFIFFLFVTVATFSAVVTGYSQTSTDGPVRAAFVYTGSTGTPGWDRAHEQGREFLKEQLGDQVITKTVEEVDPSAAPQVFRRLARDNFDIIFGTTFAYMDPMVKISKEFPDVKFEHASGFKTTENMGNYYGRMYQAKYLAGIIAGMRTESNTIGYAAPHAIPQIIRLVNAFQLGAESVNPDVNVKVVWTNSWYNPAKAKEATKSLLEAGADVINHQLTSPAPMQTAQEADAWSFGMHSDMSQFAPESVLASQVWNWGEFYVRTIKEVQNGTWESDSYFGGMEDNMVSLKLTDKITEGEQQAIREVQQKLASGEMKVFQGPLRDNKGNLKAEAGSALSVGQIRSMEWLVECVEGSLP